MLLPYGAFPKKTRIVVGSDQAVKYIELEPTAQVSPVDRLLLQWVASPRSSPCQSPVYGASHFLEVYVEPNVNKYCVVCKETETRLKLVAGGDHMCFTCLASYPEVKLKKEPKEKAEDEQD